MRYEYSVIYPPDEHGHFLKRPLVEIEIFGPQGTLKELAFIDSGVDRSLFHRDIADLLGIDLTHTERRRTIGITGEAEVAFTDIVITLPPAKTPLRIPVGFIDSPYVGVLLGQEGFFDQHRIIFARSQGIFTVNQVKR